MAEKMIPFSKDEIEKIIEKFPTPFHIYDEKAIRENARKFKKAFEWNEGFKEYFAIKAAPNPYLMKILKEEVEEGKLDVNLTNFFLHNIEKIEVLSERVKLTRVTHLSEIGNISNL